MINWDDYERGRNTSRHGSLGSTVSRVHFDSNSPSTASDHLNIPPPNHGNGEPQGNLRHRRWVLQLSRRSKFFPSQGGIAAL